MPALILGLVGFVVFALVAFLWVALSVIAALFWLAIPVGLIVLGSAIWRAQARGWQRRHAAPFLRGTGNAALDEHQAETRRRLDEEGGQFRDFLERKRKSRDKAAFDNFLAERRGRGSLEDMRGATS